jgi:hypothetical protein
MTKRYTPGPPDDKKRRAIRRSEADLVSAWDNYAAAIDAAKGGDQTRLLNLLRGHRPLEDADRSMLEADSGTSPPVVGERRKIWSRVVGLPCRDGRTSMIT